MTRDISTTDTAKLIRQALAAAFPGQKFSVKSKSYAGGSSITIKWTDGPTSSEVETVTEQFEGADFDGSQDLKTYHDSTLNGESVHFGADFVFCNRNLSDAAIETVKAEFEAMWGKSLHFDPYYDSYRGDDCTTQERWHRAQMRRSFYVHPNTQRDAELMHEHRDF